MIIKCAHWSRCHCVECGCCDKGLYGGQPSYGVCLTLCTDYDGPSRGIGDIISKVATAARIPKCGGCRKRQRKLNALQNKTLDELSKSI